ncbi:DUF1385 domain-containing protein [Desulfobaculum xiamenense]|nr:DUF1385 domain-containing protein [Desulfobaculum xiamenense]
MRAAQTVGGQAVVEGVMMRNKDRLAIAVRKPDGSIILETRPWFTLLRSDWMRKPFVRGTFVLIETLVNGIKALNFSAQAAMEDEGEEEVKPWQLALTVAVSIALALGLFVVLPHLFTLGIQALGLGGGTESLSFHVWDGLFKLLVFAGYIGSISLIPDIRRVFQYHGAEHKTIWAFEEGCELTPEAARSFSRLHPRCGTAFLLFVLSLSIVLHAVLIPALLALYTPEGAVVKQAYVVFAKFFMMIPVSAVAYELIKYTGTNVEARLCRVLCWPGLMMQYLTTGEPDDSQLEVAIAALKGAVD